MSAWYYFCDGFFISTDFYGNGICDTSQFSIHMFFLPLDFFCPDNFYAKLWIHVYGHTRRRYKSSLKRGAWSTWRQLAIVCIDCDVRWKKLNWKALRKRKLIFTLKILNHFSHETFFFFFFKSIKMATQFRVKHPLQREVYEESSYIDSWLIRFLWRGDIVYQHSSDSLHFVKSKFV